MRMRASSGAARVVGVCALLGGALLISCRAKGPVEERSARPPALPDPTTEPDVAAAPSAPAPAPQVPPGRGVEKAPGPVATPAPEPPAVEEPKPFSEPREIVNLGLIPEADFEKMKEAAPGSARPPRLHVPRKARKVLVFTESAKDLENARKQKGMKFVPHPSAPYCAQAASIMGDKTGAFEVTVESDPKVFTAEGLGGFDAIVLANVYLEGKLYRVPRDLKPGDGPTYEARQRALMDFVASGKGVVGVHNATCTALGWPEYNEMIGATHHGHAWYAHQDVPVKLDHPAHPLNAAFGGAGFTIRDDIYTFTAPYTRESLHVLLSVEVGKAPESMTAERPDGDYPVSWVKTHALTSGRVFYTSLGHEPSTFMDPKLLRHLQDGIQFALGDLEADASPGNPPRGGEPLPAREGFTSMEGWTALFDGKDLDAWQVSDQQKAHWVVTKMDESGEAGEAGDAGDTGGDGIIRYDGKAGTLRTKQSFRDYMLRVDWRLPRKADSGVFVRDNKQLNIWTWQMGSGEMWEHRGRAKTEEERRTYIPKTREDRGVGEWNTFLITVRDDKVTVELNGKEVITRAQLVGASERSPIGLQKHGDPVEYKSIYVKELPGPR